MGGRGNDALIEGPRGSDGLAAPDGERVVQIRAAAAVRAIDWREIVRCRELLYFLVWRDVKVRYKQTLLGVAWAVLQPLLAMLIFTVIFGRIIKVPSEGLPYPVFVYAGLLPWTFFSASVSIAGVSLVNQQHVLTKVYFPRLFVPTAGVCAGLMDLLIAMLIYGLLLCHYRCWPTWEVVFVPVLVLLTVMLTLAFSYFLSALTVSYRDFRYVIPFMLQVLLYLSPVVYPVSIVPERLHWLLALNPMAGIIDGYRSAIMNKPWNLTTLVVSAAVTVVLLMASLVFFRTAERRFADIV
jgi:lipopolysaccharide transport system permease protein